MSEHADDTSDDLQMAAFAAALRSQTGDDLPTDHFAFGDEPVTADDLCQRVLDGRKTATTALVAELRAEDVATPAPGDRAVVLDGVGAPACVIRTTAATIGPLGSVTTAHAAAEGEGDGSVVSYLTAHLDFFAPHCARLGVPCDSSTPVVFERFEVLWAP